MAASGPPIWREHTASATRAQAEVPPTCTSTWPLLRALGDLVGLPRTSSSQARSVCSRNRLRTSGNVAVSAEDDIRGYSTPPV